MTEILEYIGVITGLLYLYLEIRQKKAMWIVGFITSLVYVFVFFSSKIYADMGLQIYYVLISLYGFWKWSVSGIKTSESIDLKDDSITYRTLTPWLFTGITVAIIGLFCIIYNFLIHYTDSPIPIGDAITTAIGIVATWMVAQKIIEHWLFWIAVNLVSVYIYWMRDLYPTMFLYLCYAILAIIGLITWKKRGIKTNDISISMRSRS